MKHYFMWFMLPDVFLTLPRKIDHIGFKMAAQRPSLLFQFYKKFNIFFSFLALWCTFLNEIFCNSTWMCIGWGVNTYNPGFWFAKFLWKLGQISWNLGKSDVFMYALQVAFPLCIFFNKDVLRFCRQHPDTPWCTMSRLHIDPFSSQMTLNTQKRVDLLITRKVLTFVKDNVLQNCRKCQDAP